LRPLEKNETETTERDVSASELPETEDTITPESGDVGDALEQARKEARDYLDSLQRLKAEFDNFRKRTAKERQRLAELHQSLVLEAILPTLDSFEAALKKSDHSDGESVYQGLRMIHDGLMASLRKMDFDKVSIAGKPFDPELAEALMTVPTDEHPPDTVVDVISEGYQFKGRVLRPARVVVAAPARSAAENIPDDTGSPGESEENII